MSRKPKSLIIALLLLLARGAGMEETQQGGITFFLSKPAAVPIFIEGKGRMPHGKLARFLLRHNSSLKKKYSHLIARLYIQEGELEQINHDIAFAQMILETGFLKFGGAVSQGQNNFAGLGAVNNNTPGLVFPSAREGIRAHIQHLKAYGSSRALKMACVDSRFKLVRRGSATTIFDLTGKWASDPGYGEKLFSILQRLYDQN